MEDWRVGCDVDQGVFGLKVELSKNECVCVAEFIEMNLLTVIRNDVDIDNIAWVENMLNAKRALEKAVDEYENA